MAGSSVQRMGRREGATPDRPGETSRLPENSIEQPRDWDRCAVSHWPDALLQTQALNSVACRLPHGPGGGGGGLLGASA